MVERCSRACFAIEAFERCGFLAFVGRKYLDGHAATHVDMGGEVDRPHAPFAEAFEQPVFAESKPLPAAEQQLAGLKPRDEPVKNQALGELLRRFGSSAIFLL